MRRFLGDQLNGRIPAIVDEDGPASQPVSLFDPGLSFYLAGKTGQLYGKKMDAGRQ